MPKFKTACDGNLGITSVVDTPKNALTLRLNLVFIRAKHYIEDIEKCINN